MKEGGTLSWSCTVRTLGSSSLLGFPKRPPGEPLQLSAEAFVFSKKIAEKEKEPTNK